MRDEAKSSITTSLDELLDPDADPEDWDYNGLAKWAMDQFGVQVGASQLKKMDREQIRESLIEAALEQVERKDCTAMAPFLAKHYAQRQLSEWAKNKFEVEIPAGVADRQDAGGGGGFDSGCGASELCAARD